MAPIRGDLAWEGVTESTRREPLQTPNIRKEYGVEIHSSVNLQDVGGLEHLGNVCHVVPFCRFRTLA